MNPINFCANWSRKDANRKHRRGEAITRRDDRQHDRHTKNAALRDAVRGAEWPEAENTSAGSGQDETGAHGANEGLSE